MTNLQDWLDMNSENYLTINDVISLENEQVIKVLCIDRNFYDVLPENLLEPEDAIAPEQFFQDNYIAEYRHGYDLHGELRMLNVSDEWNPFNFHLNYGEDSWYPLGDNGSLPEVDPQGFCDFTGINLDYHEYPTETLIGWRGPMLKWEYIENSGPIYWNRNTESDSICSIM